MGESDGELCHRGGEGKMASISGKSGFHLGHFLPAQAAMAIHASTTRDLNSTPQLQANSLQKF